MLVIKLLSLGSNPPFNNLLYNAGTVNGRCISPLLLDTNWRGPEVSLEGWGGERAGSFQFFPCSHSPGSLCPQLRHQHQLLALASQRARSQFCKTPYLRFQVFLTLISSFQSSSPQGRGAASCSHCLRYFNIPSLLFQSSNTHLLWDEWCLPHIYMLKS